MIFDPSQTGIYQASTSKQVNFSHVPKKCGCGKNVTAKQLTQYGCCVACQRGKQLSTNSKSAASQQSGFAMAQGERA